MKTIEQKANKLLNKLSKVEGVDSITMRHEDDSVYIYSFAYKGVLGEFFIYDSSFKANKVKELVSAVIYNTFGYYDKQR